MNNITSSFSKDYIADDYLSFYMFAGVGIFLYWDLVRNFFKWDLKT